DDARAGVGRIWALHGALPVCSRVAAARREGEELIHPGVGIAAVVPPAARLGLGLRDVAGIEGGVPPRVDPGVPIPPADGVDHGADRKSTRLNSSHVKISYAVF